MLMRIYLLNFLCFEYLWVSHTSLRWGPGIVRIRRDKTESQYFHNKRLHFKASSPAARAVCWYFTIKHRKYFRGWNLRFFVRHCCRHNVSGRSFNALDSCFISWENLREEGRRLGDLQFYALWFTKTVQRRLSYCSDHGEVTTHIQKYLLLVEPKNIYLYRKRLEEIISEKNNALIQFSWDFVQV